MFCVGLIGASLMRGVMRELDRIALSMKKRRRYASFFEWPDKRRKELGIVESLLPSLANHGYGLSEPRINDTDPPDCVCTDAAGNNVALEVVELVSQEAIELNAKGAEVYRWWEPGDIREGLRALLTRKDCKVFSGGPYADIAVVVHTDEPTLTPDEVREALVGFSFGPYNQVTRAFLLFSYMPGKGYESLQLPLRSA